MLLLYLDATDPSETSSCRVKIEHGPHIQLFWPRELKRGVSKEKSQNSEGVVVLLVIHPTNRCFIQS